ncbi:MAG: thiamine pyrophosphate-binding protein [Actinobacteria bacterium]|nr:thiamine pyrophosphate-binding protein [Actinomycetota bacterium]
MAEKLSGSEFIAEYLIKEGLPYIFGLPGHGVLAFMDAFRRRQDKIKTITFRHEQAATFAADAYCRVSGRPMAVFTTVGPGAVNCLTGISTSFMDSIPMIVFTADCPVYMNEKGAMQEIERNHWADVPEIIRPIVKRSWNITDASQLADVLPRAFRIATSGRPGPVHIDMPMDVQAQMITMPVPDPKGYRISPRIQGDTIEIEKAVKLLSSAKRPLILCGGGVILSDASEQIRQLAELLGIPVVSTFNGKGCIPEDHPLWTYNIGFMGSTCGNHLTKNADIVLAVGCRFSEWTCSSYKPGITFNVPPTKIIQIDIDPREIAKNYPVEVGLLGDCKTVLEKFIELIGTENAVDYKNLEYFTEQQNAKKEWEATLVKWRQPEPEMLTLLGLIEDLRECLDKNAIVLSDAGLAQDNLWRAFPVYQPRCHISSGGSSTMGFSIPAAIGCKLAAPERQVVGLIGDGSFLMTCQELATAIHYNLPVIYIISNNHGWGSIRDMQRDWYGEEGIFSTRFLVEGTDKSSNPDFVMLARSFGLYAEKVQTRSQVKPAIKNALKSGKPALIEVLVESTPPYAGLPLTGWADYPTPEYIDSKMNKDSSQ